MVFYFFISSHIQLSKSLSSCKPKKDKLNWYTQNLKILREWMLAFYSVLNMNFNFSPEMYIRPTKHIFSIKGSITMN